MTNSTGQILATINAIQTLVENFPMSILAMFRGKTYTTVIEFVLDVIRAFGITDINIMDKLIEAIFGVSNVASIFNGEGTFKYEKVEKPSNDVINMSIWQPSLPETVNLSSPDYIYIDDEPDEYDNARYTYYVKKSPFTDDIESEFLTKLEDSLKVIIANILTGIFSCSINPEIPNWCMDSAVDKLSSGYMSFPLSLIDTFHLLDINPTNEVGQNFYDVEKGVSVNELYKTKDLDAFIWYAMNRGLTAPQSEYDKMMWDSRFKDGDGEDVFPIMQLRRDEGPSYDGRRLCVEISSKTYFNKNNFNKTIYKFNADYLRNIKIFSTKKILTNMMNDLLNGSIIGSLGLRAQYDINVQMIESKVNSILKKIMTVDDTQVSDCYFSFSNDEFDSMLKDYELKKYGAKAIDGSSVSAVKLGENVGIDALNRINSTATLNEKLSTISRTVYDISAIPASDGALEISDSLTIGYNVEWVQDFIMALMRPIIRAILSPKVILLFMINFHIMGLIDLSKIESLDSEAIMEFFYRKIIALLVSIITCIKDKLIELLMNWVLKLLKNLMFMEMIIIMRERLEYWMRLLREVISCLPTFRFYNIKGQIDDVNYADITPSQDVPEKENSC